MPASAKKDRGQANVRSACAAASPICTVVALPLRSGVSVLASAMTPSIALSINLAASTAFGSLCLRPSHSNTPRVRHGWRRGV